MKDSIIHMPVNKIVRHGWKPQLPDFRDIPYTSPNAPSLPAMVDLRPKCPPVYDQGQLGSCTANAIAGAFEFEKMKQQDPVIFIPSRLFIYYNERALEGTTSQDAGASLRDGIKTIKSQGVCPETEWPYVISQFAAKPPEQCYQDALSNELEKYLAVKQDVLDLKNCLAQGFPFIFGISVYSSMMTSQVAQTGMVPMPSPSDTMEGGHAIMCAGYDDSKQCFIIRNSWGATWGLNGYCYLPYAYVTSAKLANDFWSLRLVEN